VDFECPKCGRLLVLCDDFAEDAKPCLRCGSPAKLVGIGGPRVGNARWFRCMACGQLHMLRRGEFVKTGERAGTVEFGSTEREDATTS
jgi:hypothetical protein